MFAFLSASWLEQLTIAASGHEVGPEATVVQRVVTEGPEGEIAFVLEIDDGHVRASPGRDPRAAVTITEAWDTAVRIHQGELTAHDAIRAGLVKVRGDVRRLVEAAGGLGFLGPATAGLRERTVYA